jgi:gamma-glutamyl hercynylcysteine S-oxide synthase
MPTPASTHLPPASIDSPAMRSAGRELLSLALMDARNHTLSLLAAFENTATPPVALADAQALTGHIGWFAECWIGRNTQRALGSACPPQPTRLASIEPMADAWWDTTRANADQAQPASALRAYLLETLESTLDLLEKTPEQAQALYFFRLALLHEDLRGEQLVALAQSAGVPLRLNLPAGGTREALLVPAQTWRLGSEHCTSPLGSLVPDNEKWAHDVAVPEFEIDAQPVNWSQFVEFVDDGGYDRRELWSQAGWQWLQGDETLQTPDPRRAPRHVEQIGVARFGGSGAVMQSLFGKPTRMAGSQSALHISWWEADAWVRWAGRRLPSEVEWELAAHQAARRGFTWGTVHEWMAGSLQPWPGFAPDPWTDYSQPWFGRAKVLRGASFATRARLHHPKFRGFALPGSNDGFVGFRSCTV